MNDHSKTEIVDEFLAKHGAVMPGHVIDFALDIRTIIQELEEVRTAEPVGV